MVTHGGYARLVLFCSGNDIGKKKTPHIRLVAVEISRFWTVVVKVGTLARIPPPQFSHTKFCLPPPPALPKFPVYHFAEVWQRDWKRPSASLAFPNPKSRAASGSALDGKAGVTQVFGSGVEAKSQGGKGRKQERNDIRHVGKR